MIFRSGAAESSSPVPAPGVGVISSWSPRGVLGAGSTQGFDGFLRISNVWQDMRVRCRQGGLFE